MHTMLVYTRRVRHDAALGAWIADAVGRGDKVLYRYGPDQDASAVSRSLTGIGIDPAGWIASGQLELVDSARVRAECGGSAEALLQLHVEQLRRALCEGFTCLSMSGDGAALRALTRNEAELAAHERDLGRLFADHGVHALCSYRVDADAALIDELLPVHHCDVIDDIWQAARIGDRLQVRGEIDASNVGRFAAVLHSAVTSGVTRVDLTDVEFFAAMGVRALVGAADQLQVRGERLHVIDPQVGAMKALALGVVADHPAVELIREEEDW
jgi:anti-anti-sigma factor